MTPRPRGHPVRRGEFYLLKNPPLRDPKDQRVYLLVSRQAFIETSYSSVIAIPVYSVGNGVRTEVAVGPELGLMHQSVLRCDELTSIEKTRLTDFVGRMPDDRMAEVNSAMLLALSILPPGL